jgi:hypothetical protein
MDPAQTIVLLYAAGAFDGPKEPRAERGPPSYCEGQTVEQCNVLVDEHNATVGKVAVGFIAVVVLAWVIQAWRNK